MEKDQCKR